VTLLQARLLAALGDSPWGPECQRLAALLAADRLGPFLAFHHPGGAEPLQHLLQSGYQRGIFASVREGYLRIAFHGFHAEKDVDRVAAWLSGTAS